MPPIFLGFSLPPSPRTKTLNRSAAVLAVDTESAMTAVNQRCCGRFMKPEPFRQRVKQVGGHGLRPKVRVDEACY
jgi:hypothetical protein